jgi:hypothetical protein
MKKLFDKFLELDPDRKTVLEEWFAKVKAEGAIRK